MPKKLFVKCANCMSCTNSAKFAIDVKMSIMPFNSRLLATSGYAVSMRRNSRFETVALHIYKKWGNSRFATVTAQQSLRDCDSAYLTKCGSAN